jgi:hypothetical protein
VRKLQTGARARVGRLAARRRIVHPPREAAVPAPVDDTETAPPELVAPTLEPLVEEATESLTPEALRRLISDGDAERALGGALVDQNFDKLT